MGTEITFRRGSNDPTSGSGLTLAEPAFNTNLHTFHIGLGYGITAEWVGAPISGLSADIAAGITYKTPTAKAVKDYVVDYVTAVNGVLTVNGFAGGVTLNAGTAIGVTSSSGNITITNLGVQTFNGRTGAVQGVSAAAAGDGIAVSGATGAVTITNTGVTRAVAGTGISVSGATGSVTITNTGVQSFNGLTGAVTGASLGANTFTALNSFNAGICAAGATFTGNVNIIGFTAGLEIIMDSPTITMGDVYGGGDQVKLIVDNGSVDIRAYGTLRQYGGGGIETDSYLSGTTADFTGLVSSTVGFSGSGANLKGIVTSFNGLSGAVQGVSAAVAGTGISVSGATGAVTITNIGVQSFNGATGAVTGASLGANTFTALNTFNAGITTAYIYASNGSTFGGTLQVNGGATFTGTVNGATATFNRLLTVSGGISAAGGMTLDGGKVWHSLNDGSTSGLDAGLVHGVCGARFLENLQTGLLYGGLISVNAGNTAQVDITAGAGIVVTPGASLTAYPIPVVTPVTWTAKTGVTLSGLTSSDETWLAIDTSGNLVQSANSFTDAQYASEIPLGAALHLSRTFIQLVKTYPHVSYAQPDQFDPFIRAFGNLKLSGHEISANGANLTVNRSAGKAYAMGRNYKNDPNNPNIVTDTSAIPVTTIYHFYRNGSGAFTTTISGAIIPGSLDNGTGTLATVTPAKFTIQRLFYLPDQPTLLGVYYGRQEYNSISDAQANIPFEEFSESESTASQGIFCGWLIVKGNATALNDTATAKFINAGLFRNTANIGGGGLAIASIDDLNDVTTTTPTNNQVLRWNSGTAQWVNSDVSSLAVSSFNGLTGAVTGASLGANTFTALNTFNAGITTAFLYASTGSTFGGTLRVNGGTTLGGRVDVVGVLDVVGGVTLESTLDVSGSARFTTGLTSSGDIRFSGTATKNIRSTQAPIVITGITSGASTSYNSITLPVDNSALSLGSVSGNVTIVNNNSTAAVPGLRILTDDQDFIGSFGTVIKPGTYASAERTQTLQDASGTIALTSQLMGTINGSTAATTAVTSFNGRTGAVQGVSAAVGSTYLTVSGSTGSVTFTNTGVQTFNGLTGAVTGVTVGGTNVFTGLNTFNAGISASALTVSGGATFSGNVYLGDAATGVTAESNDFVQMMSGTGSVAFKSGFYQTYKFLAGSTTGVICVTPEFNPASYMSGSITLEITISYTQIIAGPTNSNPRVHKIIMPIVWDGNLDVLSLGDYTESITKSNSAHTPLTFTFANSSPNYKQLTISTTTGADVYKSYFGWGFRTTVQVH